MRYLVVDSGPVIKGARLETIPADKYITVPEVLGEIRDKQARSGLQFLPFEIDVKEPSHEAIARVSAFARKTGDYASLSAVDIKVLALTWMLEKECNGATHLRLDPAQIVARERRPPSTATPSTPAESVSASEPPTDSLAAVTVSGAPAAAPPTRAPLGTPLDASAAADAEAALLAALLDAAGEEGEGEGEGEEAGEGGGSTNRADGGALPAAGQPASQRQPARSHWVRLPGWATAAPPEPAAAVAPARASSAGEREPAASVAGPDAEDDSLPWITPENVRRVQAAEGGSRYCYAPDASTDVACMTTDFAMQNVLMRMGMKLLSTAGMVMKSVKQWGVQCSGCYRTAHDLGRQFCSHCGNQTLVRVALVVDRQGRERVLPIPPHVQAKVLSTRGTVYAMAAPKSGRNAGNLITAEDALAEARWKHVRNGGMRSQSSDVFDSAYDFDAHFGRAGKQTKGRGAGREPIAGVGRKNPNDVRSRPKKR